MWAADDDVWSENFISSLLEPFEENERIGLSFCEIANIDRSGNIVRRYPSFKRFESRNHIDTIVNFLRDPEILGKANLIYSLYRTALIRQVYERHGLSTVWGSDMIFVFACLCIADLRISEKLMFYKRVDPEQIIEFRNPDEHVFPYGLADEYTAGYVEAAHGTIYENVARVIMGLRKELLNKSIRGQDADKTGKVRKLLEIAGILRKKI